MPIPSGYHSITPYMIIKNAPEAIELYKKAFGAEEVLRLDTPDGRIMHAEIQVGNSRIMISEENAEWCANAPGAEGSTVSFLIYVEDVDAAFAKAKQAGLEEVKPLEEMFWGDKMGTLKDRFGYSWSIGTQVKQLSPEEIERGAKEWMEKMQAA